MAQDNIRTRWHQVRAALMAGRVRIHASLDKHPTEPLEINRQQSERILELLDIVDSCPKYFVERQLMDMLDRPEIIKSIEAMHTCKITRLPYPILMVEFDEAEQHLPTGRNVRHFVVLSERTLDQMKPEEEMFHPYHVCYMLLLGPGDTREPHLVLSPATYALAFDPDADDHRGGTGFGTHYITAPAPYMKNDANTKGMIDRTVLNELRILTDALFAVTLLLNTRGINKEVIFPEKLNRARTKSGKPNIPKHTVIRLGHVYSQDGKRKETLGITQRFHMRAGYVATRWTGQGRLVPKQVYVEPYLVNYDPANPTAQPVIIPKHVKW